MQSTQQAIKEITIDSAVVMEQIKQANRMLKERESLLERMRKNVEFMEKQNYMLSVYFSTGPGLFSGQLLPSQPRPRVVEETLQKMAAGAAASISD